MTGSVSSSDTPSKVAEKSGSRGPSGWILRSRRACLLIAGDALSFLLFAILGIQQHNQGTGSGILASVGLVISVAFPFAAGWFLTRNVLLKAEIVDQKYKNFPAEDYRAGGRFHGYVIEAVVGF